MRIKLKVLQRKGVKLAILCVSQTTSSLLRNGVIQPGAEKNDVLATVTDGGEENSIIRLSADEYESLPWHHFYQM